MPGGLALQRKNTYPSRTSLLVSFLAKNIVLSAYKIDFNSAAVRRNTSKHIEQFSVSMNVGCGGKFWLFRRNAQWKPAFIIWCVRLRARVTRALRAGATNDSA